MSTDDDGQAGVIMMAFVMGAITGAAAALLMAPAAGTETRRVLNEKAREGRQRDQLSKTIDTAIDRGREAEQGARESDPIGTEDQG